MEESFLLPEPIARVTLHEVAGVAHVPTNYPSGLELGLQDSAVYDPPGFAWSNGAHACEVELDQDTGKVRVIGYWTVDDVGTVINPMIVEGQIQGGIAQGPRTSTLRAMRL